MEMASGTACIPKFVLHAVPERMHGQLLVGDDASKALHEHLRAVVHTSILGIALKEWLFWRFTLHECHQQFGGFRRERHRAMRGFIL